MTMKAGSVGIFREYLINPPVSDGFPVIVSDFNPFRKPVHCNNFQNSAENRDVTYDEGLEWNNAYT